MVDIISKAKRSWNMGRIKSGNTKPELIVRSFLHNKGYRFKLHKKTLPGKPDIVLHRHKTVIFVHGCFWHRHKGCPYAYTPKSRRSFWQKKFTENVQRDKKNKDQLKKLKWKIVTVWECQTQKPKSLKKAVSKIR